MITVHTFASGSSGNALLVSCGDTRLLVDAGISCRRITAGLQTLGLVPGDLTAIFITHTHSDHICGLQTLLKRTVCPICATGRTCRELEYRLAGISHRLLVLEPLTATAFDGLSVTAIPTSHDAPGACGYRFDSPEGSIGLLTDSGFITEEASAHLPGVDLAILESNHDVDRLRSGPYPYYLKARILGDGGHLSNETAAEFAVKLAQSGASRILLAHLSKENNTPELALNAVSAALTAAGCETELAVLPRDELGGPYSVRRASCRK